MLAHLQKLMTFTLMAAAGSWWFYFHNKNPLLAVAGFFVITLGYTGVFACELILLKFINKGDPAPQPTWPQLFRAWWGESLASPCVFFWRQPFRAHAIPDQTSLPAIQAGRRGVVFVHGYFCNRGFWTPWLKRLQGSGHAFVAINLEPVFGSIDDYLPQIEEAVVRVTKATGLPPLLVCHSMGGLVVRAWLKTMKSEQRIHHVVTIGTPHRGTWIAQFSQTLNGRQMRLQSSWQTQLDHNMPADRYARFTCWYSNSDNIVFPVSTATLPGAGNRLVSGAAHVQMAFLPYIMNTTLAMLDDNTNIT